MLDEDVFVWGNALPERTYTLTDDTQLTLATCQSILETGEVDPAHIAETFLDWYRKGRLSGLGSATLQAIHGLRDGGHWALVGKRGEQAAGNGAAMRIAPLAFALPTLDRTLIRDVSRITHHSEEAYAGSLAVVLALRSTWEAPDLAGGHWIRFIAEKLPDSLVRDRLLTFVNIPLKTEITTIVKKFGNSGYVVDSVPLAIFSAAKSLKEGFEKVMEELVQTGGDADTNASMMGQIVGAKLGDKGLPDSMVKVVEKLDGYRWIKLIIGKLPL